jgi:hypothetical protein
MAKFVFERLAGLHIAYPGNDKPRVLTIRSIEKMFGFRLPCSLR